MSAALAAPPPRAQPADYLNHLIHGIRTLEGESFEETMFRLQERIGGAIYTRADLGYITDALIQRARRDAENRPQIITLLGSMRVPAAVPYLVTTAQSSDSTTRLYSYQALGWMGAPETLDLLDSLRADARPRTRERWMLDYAVKAVSLKSRLAELGDEARWELLRETVVSEEHWAVRADLVRMLTDQPREAVWEVLFDTYGAHPETPAYQHTVQMVIGQRYVYDHEGFMETLRQRPADQRIMGLEIIADVSHAEDLPELRDMAQNDPDELVAEMAGKLVFQMLMR